MSVDAQYWQFGEELSVSAETRSRLSAALDVVFGAFRHDDAVPICRHHVHFVVRELRAGWCLEANGRPLVHLEEERSLAPFMESALTDLAVQVRKDHAVFHAATLRWDGRPLFIAGDRGAGKSSLAWLIANEPAEYGGDDLCFIRFEDAMIEAFPKAVTLKAGAFDLAPAATTYPDPIRGPVRFPMPLETLKAPVALDDLAALFFPEFEEGAEPERKPVAPEVAALGLVQQTCGGLGRDARTLSLIGSLVKRPAWYIRYGSADDAVALVREALAA